jgi:hypothetical protein
MLNRLPCEISEIILSYLLSSIITKSHQTENYTYVSIFSTNRKDCRFNQKQKQTKKILYYLDKYYIFQKEYSYSYSDFFHRYTYTNPILCDILFTELYIPFSRSSFNQITDELLDDLKEIIRLIPDSLESGWCHLRCRTNVTPLYAACINEKIPIDIVRYLIDQGADKKNKVKVNGFSRNTLVDLKRDCINRERYNKLVELFNE